MPLLKHLLLSLERERVDPFISVQLHDSSAAAAVSAQAQCVCLSVCAGGGMHLLAISWREGIELPAVCLSVCFVIAH